MNKEKIVITGACGFIGQHLTDYLIDKGNEVLAMVYNPVTNRSEINKKAIISECDILNKGKIDSIIKFFEPSKIFHLAAQSYPTVSVEDPWTTFQTNVLGTINLFEAVKKTKLDCKILNICTSGEYGFVSSEEIPVKENHPLNPLHPYGVSKLAQEKLAYQYFQNFGIKSISLRLFNTTGPKKRGDVCSDFTKRLVEIEKGINLEKKLLVGNLETQRAITDVRDIVHAFDLTLNKATIGETYNLSGEKVYLMKDIVSQLRNLVGFDFSIEQDPKLLRTKEEPIIYGDTSKLKKETGWKQEIPLDKTLKDMISYWREVL